MAICFHLLQVCTLKSLGVEMLNITEVKSMRDIVM